MKDAETIIKWWGLAALAATALLYGCVNIAPPTDEEMARTRAEWDRKLPLVLAERAVRGKVMAERVMATNTTIQSVKTEVGWKYVAKNFTIKDTALCFEAIATYRPHPIGGWANHFEIFQNIEPRCVQFVSNENVWSYDIRRDVFINHFY